MSTIVYEGVQSCFKSQLTETTILKLKVAPITSTGHKCDIQELNNTPKNAGLEGFNYIQNISSSPSSPKEKQSSYVNPFSKTCPRLSQKSLEVCTENLGSETGSDAGTDIDILSLNDSVENSTRQESISEEEPKKMTLKLESRTSGKGNYRGFPPPLTSIRSSNPIQCRSHREDGRLTIEAFASPSGNTYFQAQRTNGRLRLYFLNHCANNFDSEINNEIHLHDGDVTHDYESDVNDENRYGGEESNDDDEKNDVNIEEEIIGSKTRVEGEIGIDKFQMLSRCMKGGHQNRNLCGWRNSMWVTTS